MSQEQLLNRRTFLSRAGALGAAVMVAPMILEGRPFQAQPAKKIRVGIIGCGSVSGMYLPHLSKSPHVELVSACDIIPERAANQASRFGIPHHYPHIDQMLAGPKFDLLVNTTDMQEHGRLNAIALHAGVNVWSEKPMANTYAEGRKLLELARDKGLRIWGAPAVVNSPQFAFMAQALNAGKLGRVAAAHAHYGHLGPDWSSFFYEKGGGSLPDLGVYNLATLTGLLGPAQSVMAMTSIVTPTRNIHQKGTVQVEAEDNAMVLMDHGRGILSHVQCGFNYFDPHGHDGDGQERPTISIYGSGGSMHMVGYDWSPFGVEMATLEAPELVRYVPDPGTYVWEEGASVICQALATGTEPLIAAEHALHVLDVIQAARASQATGKRIRLTSTFKWPVVS
ncbi:MAG: Gfo/Idh/MocA family oxidoreductase [Bacteroidia bacterium]|nr:Gfo/Idh/MocA family oxidoreductase [Bacteroidia bacterium]